MKHRRVVPTFSAAHYATVYGLTVEEVDTVVEQVEVPRKSWLVRLIAAMFTSFRDW